MNRAFLVRLLLTSALLPPTSCHVSYTLLHVSLDRVYVVLEPLVLSLGPARQFHKCKAQGRAYSTSCQVKVMTATLADPERGSLRSEGDREHLSGAGTCHLSCIPSTHHRPAENRHRERFLTRMNGSEIRSGHFSEQDKSSPAL